MEQGIVAFASTLGNPSRSQVVGQFPIRLSGSWVFSWRPPTAVSIVQQAQPDKAGKQYDTRSDECDEAKISGYRCEEQLSPAITATPSKIFWIIFLAIENAQFSDRNQHF